MIFWEHYPGPLSCCSPQLRPTCIFKGLRPRDCLLIGPQLICIRSFLPVYEILQYHFISFDLFLGIGFELFEFILGFRVAKLVLHLLHQALEFVDFFLDEREGTSRYYRCLLIYAWRESSRSLPICFCIRSFFCFIRWIFSKLYSNILSKAEFFLLSKPRFRSSSIFGWNQLKSTNTQLFNNKNRSKKD